MRMVVPYLVSLDQVAFIVKVQSVQLLVLILIPLSTQIKGNCFSSSQCFKYLKTVSCSLKFSFFSVLSYSLFSHCSHDLLCMFSPMLVSSGQNEGGILMRCGQELKEKAVILHCGHYYEGQDRCVRSYPLSFRSDLKNVMNR